MEASLQIGKRLYRYRLTGQGEGLVLLHGFTASLHTWDDLIRRLAGRYQVLALDLPGHGASKSDEVITMDQFVSDLYELSQILGLDRFHLLGYSLGGRTALSYALAYPETIRSLILESASPGLKTEKERRERVESDRQLIHMLEEKGVADFVSYWEGIPLFQSQKSLSESIRQSIRKERLSQTATGLIQSLEGMGTGAQASNWDRLSQITFPLLLIVGALDEKFVRINQEMAQRIPTSQLKIVEGAGHAVHLEKSHQFAQHCLEFIDIY